MEFACCSYACVDSLGFQTLRVGGDSELLIVVNGDLSMILISYSWYAIEKKVQPWTLSFWWCETLYLPFKDLEVAWCQVWTWLCRQLSPHSHIIHSDGQDGLQSQLFSFHSNGHLALLQFHKAAGQHRSHPNEDEEENTLVRITLWALQMLHLLLFLLLFSTD